jgi:DNA-binding helix-hairpin-helix protein with protein kinase domain
LYGCEVGVPHFTAPELQRLNSFRDLQRSVHHDNFGLAVLIFHLLFMGRHPFAGVYSGREDMPIERAIRESRYAFGRTARAHAMSRPPGSIGPEIVTAELAGLFEHAFRDGNSCCERPQARDWVQALDTLKREIRTCADHQIHRYYGRLAECPWCRLENRERLVFFLSVASAELPAGRKVDVRALWSEIEVEAAKIFGQSMPLSFSTPKITPVALPLRAQASRISKRVVRALSILVPLLLIVRLPVATLLWSLAGFYGWNLTERWNSPFELECERRKVALAIAEQRWQAVERRWTELCGKAACRSKLLELDVLREEYRRLRFDYHQARRELQADLRRRQEQRFLARFQLATANIPQVTAEHKLALASCGIHTAADIGTARLRAAGILSMHAIEQLCDWRDELERWSQLERARGAQSVEIEALARRFAHRRQQLAAILSAAPEEIRQLAASFARQRRALLPAVQQAADALAQARADMSVT